MANNHSLRTYETGNENNIAQLFKKCFGREMDIDFWLWRFRENPSGAGIIHLAWDNEKLASHYAATPTNMQINGDEYVTGLSGTTMTHPDYRGQRLFQKVAEKIYEIMVRERIAFVWGFPNSLIHRIRVRDLKWMDIYEIPTFRIYKKKYALLAEPCDKIVYLDDFDHRFDGLWDRVKKKYQIITIRDSKYLHWRYVENPDQSYQIVAYINNDDISGYAVFKEYKNEVQIIDIITDGDLEVGKLLIFTVFRFAIKVDAESVSLWLSVINPLHHELEKYGFKNESPVTYFGGFIFNNHLEKSKLYDYRNWYITMGDSDVF
jgi:hypothetical protein